MDPSMKPEYRFKKFKIQFTVEKSQKVGKQRKKHSQDDIDYLRYI